MPIPTNRTFSCKKAFCKRSKVGISSTQGGHQEAQKLTTRTFPCQSAELTVFPSGVFQGLAKNALIAGSLASSVLEIQCELKTPARRAKRLIRVMMIHCLRFTPTPSLKFADAYSYLGHLRYFHGRHRRNRPSGRTSRYGL